MILKHKESVTKILSKLLSTCPSYVPNKKLLTDKSQEYNKYISKLKEMLRNEQWECYEEFPLVDHLKEESITGRIDLFCIKKEGRVKYRVCEVKSSDMRRSSAE